ncbi:MAG: HmuY family protein, partial [Ferruginibacter sp.]|nr:HmuY family protein [Ferruginibacter sp.]
MKQLFNKSLLLILSVTVLLTACRKRDSLSPDNFVNFESAEQGIASTETSITIKLKLSAAAPADIPVVVRMVEDGLTYGTQYTLSATPVSNQLNLIVPSGNNETSFTVTKTPGAFFAGDENLKFEIYSSGSPVIIGATRNLMLTFSELVAQTPAAVVNGGGVTFGNKVFIDISTNRQTPVLRTNWDLGFYTGSNDFRVILNSSSAMMAKQINKTDLNTVTGADTVGMTTDVAFSQTNPQTSQLPYIDYPDGDLTRTAIASVSANDADNKVYIVNRGKGIGTPAPDRGWKKIRVLRNNSGGYTLQHADINASTFQTIEINKTPDHFFRYASFDNGSVEVEPEKKKWDIAWTYFSNVANFGAGDLPYLFQDIILINRNVQVAKILEATVPYANFTATSIDNLTTADWSSKQNAIGADWRSGGGPGVSPAVRTDRYYIIKDGDANYYKLRFTALTNNGERGYPSFEAVWLRKD